MTAHHHQLLLSATGQCQAHRLLDCEGLEASTASSFLPPACLCTHVSSSSGLLNSQVSLLRDVVYPTRHLTSLELRRRCKTASSPQARHRGAIRYSESFSFHHVAMRETSARLSPGTQEATLPSLQVGSHYRSWTHVVMRHKCPLLSAQLIPTIQGDLDQCLSFKI